MNLSYLNNAISGNIPLIWLDTLEFDRGMKHIKSLAKGCNKTVLVWDCERNITTEKDGKTVKFAETPPFTYLEDNENVVLCMYDLNNFLDEATEIRKLLNSLEVNIRNKNSIVVIAPATNIPSELSSYITKIDLELPSQKELTEEVLRIAEENNLPFTREEAVEMATMGTGLTLFQFSSALKLSIASIDEISMDYIYEFKKQVIEKDGYLKVYTSGESLDTLYGMEVMANFTKKMVKSKKGKGILIVGVPGSGKTEFAKRLGYDTNRVTICLDFGQLMDAYVGETERRTREAFKIIDTMSPSIVFIDELEKGLAGANSKSGDTVGQRQGGLFLKWMQDHESDAYVIATSNNIEMLPPEYLRSGRWDAIFYVGIPDKESRRNILHIYKKKYGVSDDINLDMLTYTGAEIETLCRLAGTLRVPLAVAKDYVKPISLTMRDTLDLVNDKYRNRLIPAGVYSDWDKPGAIKK